MRNSLRETLIEIGAHGAWRSGFLQMAQLLSERYEVGGSLNGTASFLQRANSPKFAILYYHRVGTQGVPFHSRMELRLFEEQIRFLRRAYRIVSLNQLCRELEEGGPQRQAVAITFDDGYRDVYTNAFPILRKYDVPATVYLTASAMESGDVPWYDRILALVMLSSETLEIELEGFTRENPGSPDRLKIATEIVGRLRQLPNDLRRKACAKIERSVRLPESELKDRMLTWQQVWEMSRANICFGAHTMNHPVVSRLEPAERENELRDSKVLLEDRLQSPVDHFAFPFGSHTDIDANACRLLSAYGYRSAVSTVPGVNTASTNRYLLRRIGAEEASVARLSLLLRWNFFHNKETAPDVHALEHGIEHETADQRISG